MDTEIIKIWPLPDEDQEMLEQPHGRPTEHTGPQSSLRPVHEKSPYSARPSAQDLALFFVLQPHCVGTDM